MCVGGWQEGIASNHARTKNAETGSATLLTKWEFNALDLDPGPIWYFPNNSSVAKVSARLAAIRTWLLPEQARSER